MTEDLLVFDVGLQHLGLPVSQVREVLPRATLTPLAGSPSSLAGLLRLRGGLLPVVDVGSRLGLLEGSPRIGQCIVVVSTARADVGLLVDAARGLISGESIGRANRASGPNRQVVRHVTLASGEVVAILDSEAAIGDELTIFLAAVLPTDTSDSLTALAPDVRAAVEA